MPEANMSYTTGILPNKVSALLLELHLRYRLLI
jgi:hypothetical protein